MNPINGTCVRSKLVIVGDCACGKTSLIHRYVNGAFLETYAPTGFNTYNATYDVSDTYKIEMSVWDTSGDGGYDRVRPLSYAEADLVIICFSVADPDSLEHVMSKGLKAGKHIGALAYSETTSKSSQRSVGDVIEIAALSSAGNKNSTEAPNFKRQRSFMRRKRFSGLNDTKSQLRKDVVKSCVVM
ncbi:rho-related GTP-binding ras-like [Octopus vulgaris]|uniref:Rho-related GTP-binding ras-like n=1 Tax=Octopus vulgaris TaxID=6645 RepID=A0AA36B7Q5_OCTVU|nr:rho-related GTP-binding ras-like [Octopus vulgaris]